MKSTIPLRHHPATGPAAVGPAAFTLLVAIGCVAPACANAQAAGSPHPAGGHSGGTQPTAARAEAGGDYLVQVGKHFMWRSQVEKMHPELAKKAVRVSKGNKNDFLVTVDKKPVWASTLRRDPAGKTRPAAHNSACKDFLVTAGKQAVRASSAQCPMGKHEKGARPLCCVAPAVAAGNATAAASAKLPRCCQDAPK